MEATPSTDSETVEHTTPADRGCVKLEGIDSDKVNQLLATVTEHLSVDARGNFYIKGSGFGGPGRQVQLREVVELRDVLLKVVSIAEGKIELVAAEKGKQGRNVGRARGGQQEALNGIVEELKEGPIRKLSDENADLKRKLAETQDEGRRLAAENVELTTRVQNLEGTVKKVSKEMEKMVRKATEENGRVNALDRTISTDLHHVNEKIATAESDMNRKIASAVAEIDTKISSALEPVNGRIDQAKAMLRKLRDFVVAKVSETTEPIENSIIILQESLAENTSGLNNLERKMNSSFQNLREDVSDTKADIQLLNEGYEDLKNDVSALSAEQYDFYDSEEQYDNPYDPNDDFDPNEQW